MIKVGIDTLAVYTSRYALDLGELAKARNIDANKYYIGLGHYKMSVPPPGEDIVTMAANAASKVLEECNLEDIEMLLFATESGIDQSKAAGVYVHELLQLPARCRVVELKQACYGATAGLQLALPFLRENPTKKILLIASDIARYAIKTPGESSQGCAAIAMILSANPRVLALEPEYGVVTESVMDFWRPNYLSEALVDGKYSSKLYLTMLERCWRQYEALANRSLNEHDYFCYHAPVPRLVEKAHQYLFKINKEVPLNDEEVAEQMAPALHYAGQMGNSYTAALYISLASLLDLQTKNLADARIGLYSYGSGCVAEFFSGVVQPNYRTALHTAYNAEQLKSRQLLTYDEYENFYHFAYVQDGSRQEVPLYKTGAYRLKALDQHKRLYEKSSIEAHVELKLIESPPMINLNKQVLNDKEIVNPSGRIQVLAPGKLILSGEHSILYGQPALAMAINRYVTATVTHESLPQILFDLADLSHHSSLSMHALQHLKERVKDKYKRFVNGDFSIRQVLQKPFELAHFALGVLSESLNLTLPHGVKIHVQSDLPIGCGMGSSAATILSVMQAISNFLQVPLSMETLYQLALEAENMQHGRSSGLDLQVVMQGGCVYVKEGDLHKRNIPELNLFLINTGAPASSTGQAVERVAPLFKGSATLATDFGAVTHAFDYALSRNATPEIYRAVRENHLLLTHIGVVPNKVVEFIEYVERSGGAAKICGSGAITGDNGGAVMACIEDEDSLHAICKQFNYDVMPFKGVMRGLHAA